jgi:hypothetical protein
MRRNLLDIPPVASVDPTLLHHRRWREMSTAAADFPLTMVAGEKS